MRLWLYFFVIGTLSQALVHFQTSFAGEIIPSIDASSLREPEKRCPSRELYTDELGVLNPEKLAEVILSEDPQAIRLISMVRECRWPPELKFSIFQVLLRSHDYWVRSRATFAMATSQTFQKNYLFHAKESEFWDQAAHHDAPEVRAAAAEVFSSRCDGKCSVGREMFLDGDAGVRSHVVDGICRNRDLDRLSFLKWALILEREVYPIKDPETFEEDLKESLEIRSQRMGTERVRRTIVDCARDLSAKQAGYLLKLAAQDPLWFVRHAAASAIVSTYGAKKWVDLLALAGDENKTVRSTVFAWKWTQLKASEVERRYELLWEMFEDSQWHLLNSYLNERKNVSSEQDEIVALLSRMLAQSKRIFYPQFSGLLAGFSSHLLTKIVDECLLRLPLKMQSQLVPYLTSRVEFLPVLESVLQVDEEPDWARALNQALEFGQEGWELIESYFNHSKHWKRVEAFRVALSVNQNLEKTISAALSLQSGEVRVVRFWAIERSIRLGKGALPFLFQVFRAKNRDPQLIDASFRVAVALGEDSREFFREVLDSEDIHSILRAHLAMVNRGAGFEDLLGQFLKIVTGLWSLS